MSDLPGVHAVDYAIALFLNSLLLLLTIYWCFKLFFPSIVLSAGSKPTITPQATLNDVPSSPDDDEETVTTVEMYGQTQSQTNTKHEQDKEKEDKDRDQVKKLPLTSKILSCSVLILITIFLWIECLIDIKGWGQWNKTECTVLSFNNVLDWIARSMLYIYYMYRSRNIFIGTALEMRKCVFKMMVTWFIFGYSLCAVSTFLWGLYYQCPPWTSNTVRVFVGWLLLNETFSQMFCLCYFIIKMRKLMKQSSAPEMTNNAAIMEAHKKMKYITKKLLILAVFYNIMAGVNVFLAGRGLYFARALEHFIVCTCMVLSFGFMDNAYKKMCCFCIFSCKNCCN